MKRTRVVLSLYPYLLALMTALTAAPSPHASPNDRGFGGLRVDSDPPGADVVVVAELGKTPLTNEFVNPGLYKIEIRHPSGSYLPVTEEITIVDGQRSAISHKLAKPPVWTKQRGIQLLLGTGAAAGFVWAVVEQNTAAGYRQKSAAAKEIGQDGDDNVLDYSRISKSAGARRTVALVSAGVLSAALQVTVFIW